MASTRNINTRGNYTLEQKSNKSSYNYHSYESSQTGRPHSFLGIYRLPDSTQPTRIVNPHNLSNNPIDVESTLRGIRSSDLVNDPFKAEPQLKSMSIFKFYTRPSMFLPDLVLSDQHQRPMFN